MSDDDRPVGDVTVHAAAGLVAASAFVIDDEDGISSFIAAVLARSGFSARTFQTCNEAIAALEDGHPAIIFLDVALKKSDAVDVIHGLRECRYRGVVQLMSGGNPTLLEAVQRIGARHGMSLRTPLQKPFRGDAIVQAIDSLRAC
jgi:DNA-binding NtrC family response regulator